MGENNEVRNIFGIFLIPFVFLLLFAVFLTIDIFEVIVNGIDYFTDVIKNNSIYYTNPLT